VQNIVIMGGCGFIGVNLILIRYLLLAPVKYAKLCLLTISRGKLLVIGVKRLLFVIG
jgi:hypothetical protein